MALLAGSREFSCCVVRVGGLLVVLGMTAVARCGKALELPGGTAFMARFAIRSRVRANQREPVLMFADLLQRHSPSFYRVTAFAIRAELPPVNVRVTVGALRADI